MTRRSITAASLRQNAIPSLASDFSGIEGKVKESQTALASAKPVDIAVASERLAAAQAQMDRANVLWLPNLYAGVDWFHHDGGMQNNDGSITRNSRSA